MYAINPLAVAHYRQRHSVSRAKSDHADAMTLADILRTDSAAHRPMPHGHTFSAAIAVLARAHQDAVWNRTKLSNQLRSLLREYFPAGIEAFNLKNVGLASIEARAILAAAPTPSQAAALSIADLVALLRQAGRQRNITTWAKLCGKPQAQDQTVSRPSSVTQRPPSTLADEHVRAGQVVGRRDVPGQNRLVSLQCQVGHIPPLTCRNPS